MSYLKIYEASTLLSSISERIKDYQNLQKQLEDLKGAFREIVHLSDFKGKAANAIKGFYRAQIDVVHAWEDFINQHLSFLKSIEGSLADRNLSGNTLVHVPFFEETLKNAAQKSNEIVSEKERELKRIFRNIDDIISLDVFSSAEFDHKMYLAEKERKDTLEKVHELDYNLVNRYQKTQPAESYAKLLFQQLLESSTKSGIISPINFNAKAYRNSDIYQAKKAELETCSKAKVEKSSRWYKVVGDVLLGIGEGAWKAVVDIFKGLIDLAISLITNPVNFFKGIMNAVTHPIDTAKYLWNGIETAWNRDVVNGNSRSRSEFFSYAAVSIIGLKGLDKIGKLGKLGKVSKTKTTPPYNVLNTKKLKDFIYNKVKTNFSNEKSKIVQYFNYNPVQITLNQAVRAVQNAKTLSTIKNVLNPNTFKKVFENTYRDVIKSPLAKTKSAIDQSIKSSVKKIGEIKVPNINGTKGTENERNIANKSNSSSKYDDIRSYMYNSFDNPGPLAEFRGRPNKNFYGGRYNIEILSEPKKFYRAGDSNSPLGQWFSETPPSSVAEVRINLAVREQWLDKNGVLTGTSPLHTVYEIEIPAGTTIYKGPVGNQGSIYLGGLDISQIYIKEPWNIEGVRVIGSNPFK